MKKITSIIKNTARFLAKKNSFLRKIMRKFMYAYRRVIYLVQCRGMNIDEHLIVFNSFNGKSYSDTPKAVYKYMKEKPEFKDYKFVWIFKDICKHEFLNEDGRTSIVKYKTKECNRKIAEAKYWIFNYRALDYWIPKKNQIYVQCWHGTPLKRLGYDIKKSDNAMNSLEEIRNKYYKDAIRFKYLLSSCEFTTKRFASAWNLKERRKENCILEVGYPRNDFLVNHTSSDIIAIKEKLGVNDIDKKIILYAPTWRDNQHSVGIGYTYKTEIDFDFLREELSDEYIILFRAHYLVVNSFDFEKYEGFIYDVSRYDDINELYITSDILITDYSSVFFDYAILKKTIIFYMYDLEKYRDETRGFYLTLEELPGEIVTEEESLVKIIHKCRTGVDAKNKQKLQEFNGKFNYLNDGQATDRFVAEIYSEA